MLARRIRKALSQCASRVTPFYRSLTKKRALVAAARKLAVLLHRLWVTGEVYEPLREATPKQALEAA